jgi:hypothetical protein
MKFNELLKEEEELTESFVDIIQNVMGAGGADVLFGSGSALFASLVTALIRPDIKYKAHKKTLQILQRLKSNRLLKKIKREMETDSVLEELIDNMVQAAKNKIPSSEYNVLRSKFQDYIKDKYKAEILTLAQVANGLTKGEFKDSNYFNSLERPEGYPNLV